MKFSTADQARTTDATYNIFGNTYTYDTSHDQKTQTVVVGADVLSGETSAGTRWVAGAMIGRVDSDLSFDASDTRIGFSGETYGAYATLVHGPAFVHGLIAANQLDIDYDAPSLGDVTPGRVKSWGYQAELGYTLDWGQNGFFEPLAGIAQVNSEVSDLEVPGSSIKWDDQTSLRVNVGGRFGMTARYEGVDARFTLTGRVWNEARARNEAMIDLGAGTSVSTLDDFGGWFNELQGGVNLTSRSSAWSAFVNAGTKWNDDLKVVEASAGIRYRW